MAVLLEQLDCRFRNSQHSTLKAAKQIALMPMSWEQDILAQFDVPGCLCPSHAVSIRTHRPAIAGAHQLAQRGDPAKKAASKPEPRGVTGDKASDHLSPQSKGQLRGMCDDGCSVNCLYIYIWPFDMGDHPL